MMWRYFSFRELEAALDWAAAGNVAVHNTGFPIRSRGRLYATTAHLFAKDEDALKQAAWSVGCQLRWLQVRGDRTPGRYTDHYDLFGTRLDRALKRCLTDAAA